MKRPVRGFRRLIRAWRGPVAWSLLAAVAAAVVGVVSVRTLEASSQSETAQAASLTGDRPFDLRAFEGDHWRPIGAEEAAPPRIALLVHGLDEPGSIWDELAPALRKRGHHVGRFNYPNDQQIAISAAQLGEALRLLRERGVRELDLVCHSMGGLVARDVLTRDAFYGGRAEATEELPDVRRLILVGTPNDGAPLARLRLLTEVREQIARFIDEGVEGRDDLFRWLDDGAGEAGKDLLPGSEYLEELNARPLPEGVKITVIAGVVSPVENDRLRSWIESPAGRTILGRERARRVADALADASDTVGDGVVPLDSALLDGVDDVVRLNDNHRSMLKRAGVEKALRGVVAEDGEAPPASAIEPIVERLERGEEPE